MVLPGDPVSASSRPPLATVTARLTARLAQHAERERIASVPGAPAAPAAVPVDRRAARAELDLAKPEIVHALRDHIADVEAERVRPAFVGIVETSLREYARVQDAVRGRRSVDLGPMNAAIASLNRAFGHE